MDDAVLYSLVVVTAVWGVWLGQGAGQLLPQHDSNGGVCNFSSNGSDYSDLSHPAITMRSMSVPSYLLDRKLYCTYTFNAELTQKILIRIQQLAVGHFNYTTQSCDTGWVRVWDGLRQPGRHRYPPNIMCGIFTAHPDVLKFSSDHALELELYHRAANRRTTLTITYKYVNLDVELHSFPYQVNNDLQISPTAASVCHWEVLWESCDTECILLSPGYPGIYPPDMVCRYLVTSRDKHLAYHLSFTGYNNMGKEKEFNLRTESPSTRKCDRDFMEVYDGPSTSSPLIGRFCGSNNVGDITTTGNELLIIFTSGPDEPPYGYRGFHGSVRGITKEWYGWGEPVPDSLCDWVYNSSQGSVSSPEHWLPSNTLCTYTLHVFPAHTLNLVLTVYGLRSSCEDYLDIWEGPQLTTRICRNTLVARRVMKENRRKVATKGPYEEAEEDERRFVYDLASSMVVVKYKTKSGQLGSHSDLGFWLSFKQVPVPIKKKSETVQGLQSDEAAPRTGLEHDGKVTAAASPLLSVHSTLTFTFIISMMSCTVLETHTVLTL